MATFAQYPEMPDEEGNKQPDGDISTQQQPTIGAPAAQVGGGSRPSPQQNSSGLTQNFGAFQEANKSKLSALKNMAVGSAQSGVDNATKSFNEQKANEANSLAANQKTFENSSFAKLNKDSDLSNAANEYAVKNVDASGSVANLAASQQYRDLQAAQDRATNLRSKAGTTDNLVKTGINAANAAQDSLLLQSNSDYRKAAQDLANRNASVAQNTFKQAQTDLGNKATDVNTTNAKFQDKARNALSGLQGTLKSDLETRGAALRQQEAAAQSEAQKTAINNLIRSSLESAKVGPNVNGDYLQYGFRNQVNAALDRGDQAAALSMLGIDPSQISAAQTAVAKNAGLENIGAANVLAQDKTRQTQLQALERLLGTGIGINPTAAPQTNAVEELIQRLTGSFGKSAQTALDTATGNEAYQRDAAQGLSDLMNDPNDPANQLIFGSAAPKAPVIGGATRSDSKPKLETSRR